MRLDGPVRDIPGYNLDSHLQERLGQRRSARYSVARADVSKGP